VPNLKLPGARTGFAYLWAIALGPVLLLATGVALLVMGFIRHVDSVAAIGAVALVASLLLPRMQGAFKIGPGGIEGDLENEFFREVIRQARESGQDAESALELGFDAERALPPPAATSMHLWELVRTTGASRAVVGRLLLRRSHPRSSKKVCAWDATPRRLWNALRKRSDGRSSETCAFSQRPAGLPIAYLTSSSRLGKG
jgi:hypothetical protein